MYKPVDQNVDFPAVEQSIMEKWKKDNSFKKSIRGDKDYIFYDGPPFANGLPHYGHLLTGYIKDLFARYHTMKGEKVERNFGWDCHGLPAEMGAEKELHISGRKAIMDYGVDKFNDYCRTSVLRYTNIWEEYIHRQGRWVDFENDYKTMDTPYMESVIWAFKELYDKGLIYKSQRVMPYSWACETPVSDFETRIDNCYREKQSKAVTAKVRIKDGPDKLKQFKNLYALIWTTTPWTLPSNLALSVGQEIDYIVVEQGAEHFVIASKLHDKYKDLIGENVVAEVKGTDLIGVKYQPIFDYFADHENAFQILHGDFVTTEDGTGIVHMAPGFGEDDQILCNQNKIETICPVDSAGRFEKSVTDYAGLQVFEANDEIIKSLKTKELWLKTEQYLHNYPHCWRTDTPLIYRSVPSWYLRVTDFKDKMVENNKQINWIPGHIKDGLFGKWLENARDWSISRNRFWGCPIPIWESDDPAYPCIKVFGSIAELEEAFDVKVDDLHMPFINTLEMPNPNDPTGKSKLRRVPEVLDCWFESGSMSFAQMHYPFENKENFNENFPADFIVEYVAQTRGWFYTMVVLATALFDKPPFLNAICHGVILGDGGQKLSKRLKNYADPKEVFEKYGSDALRWYLISSPVMRGSEIEIDKKGELIAGALRSAIKPLWNAYNFYILYANADKVEGEFINESENVLDQYILRKLEETVLVIEEKLDEYNTPDACVSAEQFFEVLNNWYIRRSRDRFWKKERDQDKISAYNTLYTVLITICKAIAPLMPFTVEEIYQNLSKSADFDSVHLEYFPKFSTPYESDVVEQMERVRDACTAALALRNDAGLRVRQPLSEVTFIGVSDNKMSDELRQLVLDEINVKSWKNLDASEIEQFANYKVKVNFPMLGKRLPHKMKELIGEVKRNNWQRDGDSLVIAGEKLNSDEYSLLLEPKEEFADSLRSISSNDALVLLNLELTDELKAEGTVRDFVRLVQNARKENGLEITDNIEIFFATNNKTVESAILSGKEYINEQTLAHGVSLDKSLISDDAHKHQMEDEQIFIKIIKNEDNTEEDKRQVSYY